MGRAYRSMMALAGMLAGSGALAAETVTYTYDARGRLVKVVHSGSVNNGLVAEYSHDKADNRKRAMVTGSSGTPPS